MRFNHCLNFSRFALLIGSLIVQGFALPASATTSDSAYRLLELDGYKVKWGDGRLGRKASVSYAFAAETLEFPDALNCGELTSIDLVLGERLSMETLVQEAEEAFAVWERVAGLSFHKVDRADDADIVLGAQVNPRGRAFANVSYAQETESVKGVRTIEKALVCLNPAHEWKVGFDGDEDVYDIRYTLVHEIGHAIGLDHPGPSGQVMAFRYTEDFDELQPGDVLGARELYGPAAFSGRLSSGAIGSSMPIR